MFTPSVVAINAACLSGDYWSGRAQDSYEAALIEEARAIVDGASGAPPTVEHLRVLFAWLDGQASGGVPEDSGTPF